jgi:hypothetical protein
VSYAGRGLLPEPAAHQRDGHGKLHTLLTWYIPIWTLTITAGALLRLRGMQERLEHTQPREEVAAFSRKGVSGQRWIEHPARRLHIASRHRRLVPEHFHS